MAESPQESEILSDHYTRVRIQIEWELRSHVGRYESRFSIVRTVIDMRQYHLLRSAGAKLRNLKVGQGTDVVAGPIGNVLFGCGGDHPRHRTDRDDASRTLSPRCCPAKTAGQSDGALYFPALLRHL